MDTFKLKLPFLDACFAISTKSNEYEIFDENENVIGTFDLKKDEKNYYAHITLEIELDEDLYVQHKGFQNNILYTLESIQFTRNQSAQEPFLSKIKDLIY